MVLKKYLRSPPRASFQPPLACSISRGHTVQEFQNLLQIIRDAADFTSALAARLPDVTPAGTTRYSDGR